MRIFGCPTYAHVDNGKLEPRSIKCVFIGFNSDVKGYKLWCQETRKVVISRDVVFDETSMLRDPPYRHAFEVEKQNSGTHVEFEIGSRSTPEPTFESNSDSVDVASSSQASPQYSIAKDRPRRDIRPPQRYREADLVAYALNVAEEIDSNEETHFIFRGY